MTRRRIAEGREAEIFEYDDTSVLKLFREDRSEESVRREAAAMDAVRAAGGPAPASRGIVREQDRPGLLIERLNGPDMLSLLGERPWFLFACGRMLGETHALLHDVVAPPELPAQKERFSQRIEEVLGAELQDAGLAQALLKGLSELPQGDRICHGDYHPGNVLVTPDGPRVIDWPGATRGDPHADVARALLIFDIASVPEGSPKIVRLLERYARRYIRSQYLTSYQNKRRLDPDLLLKWRLPVVAERLGDGIDDEREKLIGMLMQARNSRSQ